MEHLNQVEIETLITKAKGRGLKILEVLNKQKGYSEAFNSEVGRVIFMEVILLLESNLEKIINETATAPDRAEYRVLKKIMDSWVTKISLSEKKLQEARELINT